jgi:peptidoglycan/xylan/chitin deacetylase (PgdA/CDA1 family)
MPRFKYPESDDGQRHSASSGSGSHFKNRSSAERQPAVQPDSHGDAPANPYAAGHAESPNATGHAVAPVPADQTQRAPQAGAYVPPATNPYAAGDPYASPYQASYEDNPYASGPSTGAVEMGHEQVGSRSRDGRRHRNTAGQGVPGAPRKRRRRVPAIIVVLLVLAVLGGGGAYLYFNPPIYRVNVNGTDRMVRAGSTLQDVVDEGFASPTAGDLIAVDGSVCKEGGGDPFEATVNGTETADPKTVVPRHAVVQINDGNDADEECTETTETLPHGEGGEDMSSFNLYWAGSMHVYSNGEDGEQVTRTGNVSGISVTEVTKQPVDAGYHVYTTNTNGDKVIALTFDDGPWPGTTSEILDVLKENDTHATFFEIGNQVAENADVVKRIHDEGNQIATHTWDHASGSGGGVDLTKMSADEQIQEVDKGFQAIEDVLGTSVTRIMRAPGGNYHATSSGNIITNLADHVTAEIGWDVDTEDWRRPGAQAIADRIMSVKPGDVVLMHDGGGDRSQTVEALKIALPQLKAQGYRFVTIDELMSSYGMSSND